MSMLASCNRMDYVSAIWPNGPIEKEMQPFSRGNMDELTRPSISTTGGEFSAYPVAYAAGGGVVSRGR